MSSSYIQEGVAQVAPFRYALGIEYAGANYHGWQSQRDDQVATVQETLESALSKIANHPVGVICAGRTDTGVNGCYQVVHFDAQIERPERAWVRGTNTHLPDDIAVLWAKPVSDQFHARFSAMERRYRYVIYSAPVKPAILSRGVSWTHKELELSRMQTAAQHLLGEHDFTSYRAIACQAKSPVKTVKSIDVYPKGKLIVIDICANAFLHHMVRNVAGVLMKIGAGEAQVDWSKTVLDARDRRLGGVTAPPWGLYFVDVRYPDQFDLPAGNQGPFFL